MTDPTRAVLRYLPIALIVAAYAWLIPVQFGSYWLRVFTSATIIAIAAVGIGVLYGRLGLVSLAQYALLGVGGWSALRLAFATGMPFLVVMLLGGLIAAIIGMLVGLPALRLRGLYLALVTLMAAGAFNVVIINTGFPDGGGGFLGRVSGQSRTLMPRPSFAETNEAYFRFSVVVAVLAFVLVLLHIKGRPGRAWAMIRRSEAAALSAGVNVTLYKTWAFTLAGFLAGIAGGLLAGSVGSLSENDFAPSESMLLFALSVSAGAFHLFGAALAGLLSRALPALLDQWEIDADVATIIFGFLLTMSLTAAPEGAAGQLIGLGKTIWHKLFRRGRPVASSSGPAGSGEEPATAHAVAASAITSTEVTS